MDQENTAPKLAKTGNKRAVIPVPTGAKIRASVPTLKATPPIAEVALQLCRRCSDG